MLKTLIKVNLLRLLSPRKGTKSKISKNAKSLLIAYIAIGALLILSFAAMAFGMAEAAKNVGTWFYCEIGMIVAFLIMVVGSVFYAVSAVFDAKDNDLLLSMPIPAGTIVISRLVTLVLLIALSGFTVCLPFAAVGVFMNIMTVWQAALFFIVYLLLICLSTAVVCFVAWAVSFISAHVRHKQIVQTVLMFIAFAVYIVVYMNFGTFISYTIKNAEAVASVMAGILPFYMAGLAAQGDWLMFSGFAALSVLPALLAYFLLKKSFVKVVTSTAQKSSARARAAGSRNGRVRSVHGAIVSKEIRRFTQSPIYLFNAGFGLLVMLALGVFALVKRADMLNIIANMQWPVETTQLLTVGFSVALLFMSSMAMISAPSVSLEKNNLWILRASPVRGSDVLTAKADAHVVIAMPFLAPSAAMLGIASGSLLSGILIFSVGAASTALVAHVGVVMNMLVPRFDIESDTQIIKQSGAVFLTMIAGIVFALLSVGVAAVFTLILGGYIAAAVLTLICAAVSLILRLILKKPLARKFESFAA